MSLQQVRANTQLQGTVPVASLPVSVSVLESAQSLVAATGITFPAVTSGRTYTIKIFGVHNTTGAAYQLQFNGDAGANYRYDVLRTDHAGNSNRDSFSGNSNFAVGSTHNVAAAGALFFEYKFRTLPADATFVMFFFSGSYDTGNWQNSRGAGRYDGASALSSVAIAITAGTFTGTVELWSERTS